MIWKIKVQVIHHSLEDSSPRVKIVRLKLQYARNLCYLDWKFNKYMLKYEFSLKIKTPTTPNAFLKVILKSRTVPDS